MKINLAKFSWSASFKMVEQLIAVGAAVMALSACGPGLASLGPFTIGGTVAGLTGTVVLQNNGKDDLSLTANGSFTFVTKSAKDATYAVTVLTQPSGQICTVNSGTGTATDNVTTLSVECVTQWKGTKLLGGQGAESFGQSVAVDASGNVYVTGETYGWLDGNSLVGTSDLFLTKYNISGAKQFTKTIGVKNALTSGQSVVTDSLGNVYVVGFTTGTLGSKPKVGDVDSFVIKYNSKGEVQYTTQLGVALAKTYGISVVADSGGNVYVAGKTNGDLVGKTQAVSTGVQDFFVTKYDSNLNFIKTMQLGVAAAQTEALSVATDSSGNVYVAGYTNGDLVGKTQAGSTGSTDLFVTQYDSSLSFVKTMQLGVPKGSTVGRSVTVDSSGNVYVAGDTSGVLPGVVDGFSMLGTSDAFVAKYGSNGVLESTWQLDVPDATAATTIGHSVVVDAKGNVYMTGETTGILGLDTFAGTKDFFIVQYNSSGIVHYIHQLGVVGRETIGLSLALDSSGNFYVTGNTYGGLDGNVVSAPGLSYFFVTKYDNNGVKQ